MVFCPLPKMEKFVKKLALWNTKTFNPIMTHEELEPIMSTLGFIALFPRPASGGGGIYWKEYVFTAPGRPAEDDDAQPPPRPRLPYPRIDGLHLCTYRAFFDVVGHFLSKKDISVADHLHVRGMPLQVHDRAFEKKFRWMNSDSDEVFVYREGTVDHATLVASSSSNTNSSNNSSNTNPFCLISLKDLVEVIK